MEFKGKRWPCSIVIPYTEKSLVYEKPELKRKLTFTDWKLRRYQIFFMGRFYKNHKSYILRNEIGKTLHQNIPKLNSNKPAYRYIFGDRKDKTGKLAPCENCDVSCSYCALQELDIAQYLDWSFDSKFSLIMHGDSPSTSRLYDAIASGSIPIIISRFLERDGLPFTDIVPYRQFMFFIDEAKYKPYEIVEQIYNITTNTPDNALQPMFETMMRYSDHLLWRQNPLQVVTNILNQAILPCDSS